MPSYEQDSCIHGYHLYQSIWTAGIGKFLTCEREPMNSCDRYAVAVLKDDVVVDHLPRKLSWILSLFLLRNGTIDCVVIGGEDIQQIYHRGTQNTLQVNFSMASERK